MTSICITFWIFLYMGQLASFNAFILFTPTLFLLHLFILCFSCLHLMYLYLFMELESSVGYWKNRFPPFPEATKALPMLFSHPSRVSPCPRGIKSTTSTSQNIHTETRRS